MKQKAPYRTRQQQLILDYLAANTGRDITVAQMEKDLSAAGASIGTATIYRQLEKLVQAGQVRRYNLDRNPAARYEYLPQGGHCHQHMHLKCQQCGTLVHLQCRQAQDFQSHIKATHGFAVDQTKTVLYGTCQSCLNTENPRGQKT